MSLGQLTDVHGIVIGVTGGQTVSPESGQVPGTIDFDYMRLVDNVGCQSLIDTDLNADCVVDLHDISIIANDWLLTY